MSAIITATSDKPSYVPHGILAEAWASHASQNLVDGPAGTGKSRMWLERVDALARKYTGSRHYICRKTRKSITNSAQVTFERFVLGPQSTIKLHKGDQSYKYPNGSEVCLLGLDDVEKTKSMEADTIYVNEATECEENDVEMLTRALRWPVMPYKQLNMDCNPDAPKHWLRKRCDRGITKEFPSRHEDNPKLWDRLKNCWTEFGRQYIAILDALTGVRYKRLRKGIWCSAEGIVLENWDDAENLINWFEPPVEWPRYWTVDFGYTNPFCWQAWAEDPDGRLYRYREIYYTQRLVEDHAVNIAEETKDEPRPQAVICDHDAEDRATLEKHLGVKTIAAHKAVSPGLQALNSRIRKAGDGRARLFLMRDALVERDPELDEKKLPACTEEEVGGYVWDKKKEAPVKKDDHGIDPMRYMVAYKDLANAAAIAVSDNSTGGQAPTSRINNILARLKKS